MWVDTLPILPFGVSRLLDRDERGVTVGECNAWGMRRMVSFGLIPRAQRQKVES